VQEETLRGEVLKHVSSGVDPGRLLYKTRHHSIHINDVIREAPLSTTTLNVGQRRKIHGTDLSTTLSTRGSVESLAEKG